MRLNTGEWTIILITSLGHMKCFWLFLPLQVNVKRVSWSRWWWMWNVNCICDMMDSRNLKFTIFTVELLFPLHGTSARSPHSSFESETSHNINKSSKTEQKIIIHIQSVKSWCLSKRKKSANIEFKIPTVSQISWKWDVVFFFGVA